MTVESIIESGQGFRPFKTTSGFIYSTNGYDSYRKCGIEPPEGWYRADRLGPPVKKQNSLLDEFAILPCYGSASSTKKLAGYVLSINLRRNL